MQDPYFAYFAYICTAWFADGARFQIGSSSDGALSVSGPHWQQFNFKLFANLGRPTMSPSLYYYYHPDSVMAHHDDRVGPGRGGAAPSGLSRPG